MQRKQCINAFITCSDKAWSNMFKKNRFKWDQVQRGAARTIKGMKKAVLLEISWCEQVKEENIISGDKKREREGYSNKEQYRHKIKCPRIYLGWN